jgi:hypothetical protein
VHFRAQIDAPTTLEDFVGQAGKKMLLGDLPPPPLRSKENWSTGLRFFEKARKSNFVHEVMYPLAKWTRERWTETLDKGIAFLAHIEDNVPVLREVLEEKRNDQPFIANTLLGLAPAVDMELNEEYQGFLRSLSRRNYGAERGALHCSVFPTIDRVIPVSAHSPHSANAVGWLANSAFRCRRRSPPYGRCDPKDVWMAARRPVCVHRRPGPG